MRTRRTTGSMGLVLAGVLGLPLLSGCVLPPPEGPCPPCVVVPAPVLPPPLPLLPPPPAPLPLPPPHPLP